MKNLLWHVIVYTVPCDTPLYDQVTHFECKCQESDNKFGVEASLSCQSPANVDCKGRNTTSQNPSSPAAHHSKQHCLVIDPLPLCIPAIFSVTCVCTEALCGQYKDQVCIINSVKYNS